MEFSSLAGKMFKALSEKEKQKYVELARVAREEYQEKVQKLQLVLIIIYIVVFKNFMRSIL